MIYPALLFHLAFYQGYPCKAAQYRRSPGLMPEHGYVDIDLAFARKVQIKAREVPWRAANGFEFNGQMDIATYFELRSRSTVTTQPELPAPEEGGFNPFGDLVLRTYDYYTGTLVEETRYRDVYVDSAGLEEITPDLAEIERHDRGTVRVPLTDVRRWYQKHGGLFCEINVRLKSGEWNPLSLNPKTGKAWLLTEILEFLFSQLPGSPKLKDYSALYDKQYDLDKAVPEGIVGEGEPVAEHLQKLLDRFGLEPQMLPDNNWLVGPKFANKFEYKRVPAPFSDFAPAGFLVPHAARGGVVTLSDDAPLHYEKKTSTLGDRPPEVVVVGKRRVRRITVPYIPVLQDTDSLYYPLALIAQRWGYSLQRINEGAYTGHEKNFEDVTPLMRDDPQGGRLHELRKRILTGAYRIYAPRHLFELTRTDTTSVGGGGVSLKDADREFVALLPMRDAPWYKSELANWNVQVPTDRLFTKGDREEYVLIPPLVRAQRVGQGWFNDFKPVREQFDKLRAGAQARVEDYLKLAITLQQRAQKVAQFLRAPEQVAVDTLELESLTRTYFMDVNANPDFKKLSDDVRKAGIEVGKTLGTLTDDEMAKKSVASKLALILLNKMQETYLQKAGEEQKKLIKWEELFREARAVYDQRRGLRYKFNLPHHALETGAVTLDPSTGLLRSSSPLCHVDKPFALDGDTQVVIADGAVLVTYGYELQDNNVMAWTNFLFTAGETEKSTDIPKVKLAGVCRSSPLKARVEPMSARLYELDEGTPVNLNATFSAAYERAAQLLSVPSETEGHVYELSGFHNVPLDAGVSSVQHAYDGALARTHVAVNAPNARMPSGPPWTAQKRGPGQTGAADRRETLEREKD